MSDSTERRVKAVEPFSLSGSRGVPAEPLAHDVSICIGETAMVRPGDVLVHPIDLNGHLRGIPDGIYVKGYSAHGLISHLVAAGPEAYSRYMELHPGSVPVLKNLPARDILRRVYDAACLAHPAVPVAEALRRVGRSAYGRFLGSLFGKMIFAALGKDLDTIYVIGPRAFTYVGTTVRAIYTRLGDQHFRYDYNPCFGWLDSYHVGIVEGAATACGCSTELSVQLTGPYHGSIECRWF